MRPISSATPATWVSAHTLIPRDRAVATTSSSPPRTSATTANRSCKASSALAAVGPRPMRTMREPGLAEPSSKLIQELHVEVRAPPRLGQQDRTNLEPAGLEADNRVRAQVRWQHAHVARGRSPQRPVEETSPFQCSPVQVSPKLNHHHPGASLGDESRLDRPDRGDL